MLPFLLTHWYMVLIALISGLLLLWPMFAERAGGLRQIAAQEAVQLMNRKQALLLDAREEKVIEREGKSIAQARPIPASQLEGRVSELKKLLNKPVIVQSSTGQTAALACNILQKNGFTDVYALAGGVDAWEKAGLPVQKPAPR